MFKVTLYVGLFGGVGYLAMKFLEQREAELRQELEIKNPKSISEREKNRTLTMQALRNAADSQEPLYLKKRNTTPAVSTPTPEPTANPESNK